MQEGDKKLKVNRAFLLFEQSGTFKNEFKKLGIEAYDYDILNEYGETDYQLDLFAEIRGGYEGNPSIFDDMTSDDIIFAFFPCTRFEDQILLSFRGQSRQQKNQSDIQKLEYDLKLHRELSENYNTITKLAILVIKRGLRLVFENPYSAQHYLTRYWCLKPSIIDKNRRERGDYFSKPTQYWFIGAKPEQNLIWEVMDYVECKTISNTKGKERSEMHPQYARRFIREFILEGE